MSSFVVALAAAAALVSLAGVGHAQDGDRQGQGGRLRQQDVRRPASSQKTYACFVRRYDANHLAQHPKQKVSAMKLLVTAENPPEEKTTNYSFRLGVKYRHRPGNFDSSGYCSHVVAEDSGRRNPLRLRRRLRRRRHRCGDEGRQIRHYPARADHDVATQQAGRRSQQRCWWPAPTTRFSGSIAPTCANVPSS